MTGTDLFVQFIRYISEFGGAVNDAVDDQLMIVGRFI